jgi:hypothetical protein
MKVAFVKQVLDVAGPWASVRWQDTTPEGLFSIWPCKATLWEATCLLKADWYVIPQQINTEYTKDAVLKYPGRLELVMNNVKNVVDIKTIPFEQYDIVISFDPILSIPKYLKTVFAYYMAEHWERLYADSLKKPVGDYDVFLAHMLNAPQTISSLPGAISFPYLRDPDTMRAVFCEGKKEESVWIDWRTFEALGSTDAEHNVIETASKVVKQWLGIPVRYKSDYLRIPYGISNPPRWADAAAYLRELGRSKYYVSVGRDSGAGQGLCDAASLGCICIGEQNKPFHKIVCHPDCLCANTTEMLHRLGMVMRSPEMQKQVCAWQDRQIREYFIKKPLELLKEASCIKAKAALASNKGSDTSVDVLPETRYDITKFNRVNQESFTIFSMPKPFTEAFALIQKNAIKSWMELKPRPEIILFGDDAGIGEFAEKHGLKHVRDVQRNEFGTPLVSDLFLKAQKIAANETCVYVNADIILMNDFGGAIGRVGKKFEQFLMIGRRWDYSISEKIKFDIEGWDEQLRRRVSREGYYHEPTGIDYFAFRKGLWKDMPPFAIGRGSWDNWLVQSIITSQHPVVDASESVMIVHQNHNFSHVRGGKDAESFKIEERQNHDLAPYTYEKGFTTQAIWKLTPEDVKLKSVSEFFQSENLATALGCIDKVYQLAPDVVKKQYEDFAANASAADLAKLSIAARAELTSGTAMDAAKMILCLTNTKNQTGAIELFRKGYEYLHNGNAAEALKYLEQAASNFAGLPALYLAIAAAYVQLGHYSSAEKACRIEIALRPEDDSAKQLLGQIEKAINEQKAQCLSYVSSRV